jgi:class 3 adenylate cyclase
VSAPALRTTAILKTDIARSTPRFRALAEAELTKLIADHRAMLTRVGAAHGGHIVKPEGDGYWLAFPSVTAASLAAMAMQEELRLGQSNVGGDRIAMRIVITLGDVLHQEGALVGDAVVLAARIEAVTPPDEIYVSEAAWLAMSRAEIRTARVDSFALKSFAEPVAVYRIEQTHRTHVIADTYIVVTDLRRFTSFSASAPTTLVESVLDGLHDVAARVCEEFNGVVRFNVGDGYCLTFSEAVSAMAGARNMLALWEAFLDKTGASCLLHLAIHKGTLYAFRSYLYGHDLNIAFGVESTIQRAGGDERNALIVTGAVRRDLEGTPWAARLVRVPMTPTREYLKDVEVYTLGYTSAQSRGGEP